MFGWLKRHRTHVPRRPIRARPGVERLEARDCLAAPTISLAIAYGAQRTVILSGTVTDESPGTTHVTIGGMVNGFVTPDASGHFSYMAQALAQGPIMAFAVDNELLASNLAHVMAASAPPTITGFTAVNLGGNNWKFTGKVIDENPAGLMVRLNGTQTLANVPVLVAADGWFTITLTLQPGEHGIATAVVEDWWGLDSNVAQALIE